MTLMTLEPKGRGVENRRLTLGDPIVYLPILHYIIGIRGKRSEKVYPLTFSLKVHKCHKCQVALSELILRVDFEEIS